MRLAGQPRGEGDGVTALYHSATTEQLLLKTHPFSFIVNNIFDHNSYFFNAVFTIADENGPTVLLCESCEYRRKKMAATWKYF